MLLSAIGLWALNLTVSRYILTHGLQPLAFSTARYGLAALIFVGIALGAERSLWIARRDLIAVVAAAFALWVNQIGFVYSLKTTSASVIALILAATPIFAALIGLAVGTERLPRRFWVGAVLSVAGVGLVALGSGGALRGDLGGILLGVMTAATWAVYSILITPLMQRYSPSRISAVVLSLSWLGILLLGLPQTRSQDWHLGWQVWALFLFATIGPLVITNVLWFKSLDRIGPSRATLATNLQPFAAALVAVVVLGETIGVAQALGGVLIGVGIRGDPAATHRSRLGRCRRGVDRDQA